MLVFENIAIFWFRRRITILFSASVQTFRLGIEPLNEFSAVLGKFSPSIRACKDAFKVPARPVLGYVGFLLLRPWVSTAFTKVL